MCIRDSLLATSSLSLSGRARGAPADRTLRSDLDGSRRLPVAVAHVMRAASVLRGGHGRRWSPRRRTR
eukprot:5554635-Pyramimonas_sp.AAC.1